MIKIENVETYGWEPAIRGMRNPINSWDKSTTTFSPNRIPILGDADRKLMRQLANAGDAHGKFLRRIYYDRRNHKLDEWRDFCEWICTLPYAKDLLTGESEADHEETNGT